MKMKGWQEAAIGVALGAVGYAVVNAGGYLVTKATDATFASSERNRWILSVVLAGVGAYLAKKGHVAAGIGLGAGAIASGPGTWVTMQLQSLLAKTTSTMSAVFGQNMSGPRRMNAVYARNMSGYQRMNGYVARQLPMAGYQRMNSVYGQNMSGMGDFAPAAPWKQPHPFG